MAVPIVPPQLAFVDANGAPYAGGSLTTYVPGTSTLATTWQDAAEQTANTNPIVLDTRGSCEAFGNGDYRLVLADVDGTQIFDLDSGAPLDSSAISSFMLPVVGATTASQAMALMGVTAAIDTALANVEQQYGPTGPTGPAGPSGGTGPTGPSGSSGNAVYTSGNPWSLQIPTTGGTTFIMQGGNNSTDSSGFATVNFNPAFPTTCSGVFATVGGVTSSTYAEAWIGTGINNNASFSVTSASPAFGGNWHGGPIGFYWFAIGF